jgi:coatomer protein complex subunit alpha (xenin)
MESAPGKNTLPAVPFTLTSLVDHLKAGYRYFHKGKFDLARGEFDAIMHSIPLVVVETRTEEMEVKQLLEICREYITGLRLQLARKEGKSKGVSPKRIAELAAYFTNCKLQPAHLALALDVAMSSAYRLENFITAAGFARRLIDMPQSASSKSMAAKAQKVLSASERKGRNKHELDYDERNPFVICSRTLTPIYKGSPFTRCPYCGATFKPEFKDELCEACGISRIGVKTLGLVCYQQGRR